MWETWVQSLGWEDPLEKETATHSNILAWRIPWTVLSMGSPKVELDWATFTFTFCVEAECSFLGVSCSLFWKSQHHWGWFRKTSRSPCPPFPRCNVPTTSVSSLNLLVLHIKPSEPQELSLCTLRLWGVGGQDKAGVALIPFTELLCIPSILPCWSWYLIRLSPFKFLFLRHKSMSTCAHLQNSEDSCCVLTLLWSSRSRVWLQVLQLNKAQPGNKQLFSPNWPQN